MIPNIPPGEEWYLSAAMQSIAARGALQPRKVVTGKDGEEADLGDLTVQPGLCLSGHVQLSDGKPIPAAMTVRINQGCLYCAEELAIRHPSGMVTFDREFDLSDFQSAQLPPDGRFEFAGLPAGPYTIIAAVQDYETAPGYTPLAPRDRKPEEQALWSRQSESGTVVLTRECAVEIRIDHDTVGLAVKLQPAPPR